MNQAQTKRKPNAGKKADSKKLKRGMVMVRDIVSAKSGGMPQSAISTGVVNDIAPTDELPEKLIVSVQRVATIPSERPPKPAKEPPALEKILMLLRERTRQDFSLYKRSMVYRRIERRMGFHQIDSINEYVRYLQKNEQEITLLFKDLLLVLPTLSEIAKRGSH